MVEEFYKNWVCGQLYNVDAEENEEEFLQKLCRDHVLWQEENMENNKAVIIGAGKVTHDLIEYLKDMDIKFSDCFWLCLDNDNSLWGTKLDGVVIDRVERLQNYTDLEIVISSIYEKDIRKQLKSLNADGHIMNHIDYMRELMVDHQIRQYHHTYSFRETGDTRDIKELTVYTAIIGGYDYLHEIIKPDKSVKYVCFTDDPLLRSDTWEVRYIHREFDDPILESRKYKMLPHLFIDTEFSLYIDANIQLNKSPLEYMRKYFKRGDMLLLPHQDRDCIYREMAVCILGNKDLPQRLIKQVNVYSKDGCPEHSGLFWGGMIGRRHYAKKIVEFDETWWDHFQKYSRRDQISLGYLIWKKGTEISLADFNICNNGWITVDGIHKS